MKCDSCRKEFDGSFVKEGRTYDRGDGVKYGTTTYGSTPVCPHCGYNNSPKVYLEKEAKNEEVVL